MTDARVTVMFLPEGRRATGPAGTTLFELYRGIGGAMTAPCGGRGLCGKCRARVLEGAPPPDEASRRFFPPEALADGWRLACRLRVEHDLVVTLPDAAPTREVIISDFTGREPEPDGDAWLTIPAALPLPDLSDQRDDLERLAAGLGREGRPPSCPLPLLRELPRRLRAGGYGGVAVLHGDDLVDFAPPGTALDVLPGLAVDLGTTTLAGALCDLRTGRTLSVATRANPQSARGDDVVTRIAHASAAQGSARELAALAAEAVDDLLRRTCREAGVDPERVAAVAVGGNTTMHHLLLGLDASGIAASPFVPCVRRGGWWNARAAGLSAAGPGAKLFTVPNLSSYIGGDVVAGLLAHRVHDDGGNVLFLDLGTNGEMALRAHGKTVACSTAAGPAFEGARIAQGMRAVAGAITRVDAEGGRWRIASIGDGPPVGLCGTGLLDAVAALLEIGAVDETGCLLDAYEWQDQRPDIEPSLLSRRVTLPDGTEAFRLSDPEADAGPGVFLTQRDVRELQLAKGAVAAGVRVMLDLAGIRAEELDRVWLAGGFGSFLRGTSALRIGLLPEGIAPERITAVGNAALAGTRLCLVSEAMRDEAERIAREVHYLELSGRADFQTAFAEGMGFPEN